jgi:pyridoxamine 5'-phosphate oxidase
MDEPLLRDRLRALPVFDYSLPEPDATTTGDDPIELFVEWLEAAIDARVEQPHAMTLATASKSGIPSSRTLLLKDVTRDGLWFATSSGSPKGRDLAENPRAALTFYWRSQGRQVRVTGMVTKGARAVSEADFLARHPIARATFIAGNSSEPLPPQAEREAKLTSARALIESDPSFVPGEWSSYVVDPDAVEFWQAAGDHSQTRLKYVRLSDGWSRESLWP